MKILTISIAAYNVEQYLDKTLSSMIDDRIIDDLEILIVDDGSKDNTAQIAITYEESYPNSIHYVVKENGGHGSTINKGISLATGKYFKVIDGDDWVDTEKFVAYVNKLKDGIDEDIILNSYVTASPTNEKYTNPFVALDDGRAYSLDEQLKIGNMTLHTLTVKTELLQNRNIHITERCFYVDVEYIVWAIYLSKTVRFYDLPLYMYRVGNANQSISKKNMIKNVAMQKQVSHNLIKIADRFLKEDNINENKLSLILNRIKRSVASTMRTYMLLPNQYEMKDEIKKFDKEIKESSILMYDWLGKDKFFKSVRLYNYAMVPIISRGYKFYCRCKHYEY